MGTRFKSVLRMRKGGSLHKLILFFLFLIFSFPFLSSAYAQQVILVIAGKDFPVLSKEELKEVYLGFKRVVDSTPISRIYVLKEDVLKEEFARKIIGLSSYREFKAHWLSRALSGQGSNLLERSENEIIEAVRRERGAIGFVSGKTELPPDVKVVLEIK